MSGRKLTEPEAWREVARRIAEWRVLMFTLSAEATKLFFLSDKISHRTLDKMYDRLAAHHDAAEQCGGATRYDVGAKPEARILAALWLALEAEDAAWDVARAAQAREFQRAFGGDA